MALVTLVEAAALVGWSLRTMKKLTVTRYLIPREQDYTGKPGRSPLLYDEEDVYDACDRWRTDHPRGRPWRQPDTP